MDEPGLRSLAFVDIPVPDFADVQIVPLPDGSPTDPVQWAETVFSVPTAPLLVRLLLALRQLLVRLIGVPKADAGVFRVKEVVGEEALIAGDDRHLDFRVGVGVDAGAGLVRVTTAVRFHGWRGRLYFIPVGLLHGPVTRAMLSQASLKLARS